MIRRRRLLYGGFLWRLYISYILQFIPVQWRIYIVKFWTPPSRSNFLQFHAIFGKFWPNNREGQIPITYPNSFIFMQIPAKKNCQIIGGWRPHLENPGCATADCWLFLIFSILLLSAVILFHITYSMGTFLSLQHCPARNWLNLAKQSNRPWQARLPTGV